VAVLLGILVLGEPFTPASPSVSRSLLGSWLATRRAPLVESEPHA
jgi:hypothetical protein